MRYRTAIRILLPVMLSLASCGEADEPPRPFVLAEVSATNLVKQGMEKEIVGDTVISGIPLGSGDTALSHDSSKLAWCDRRKLYVADVAGGDGVVLHDEEGEAGIVACLRPEWSQDGSELQFMELTSGDDGVDSIYQMTRVIIALAAGDSE